MKMLKVDTVEQVKEKLNKYFSDMVLDAEDINIENALGRVAAEDVFSGIDLPEFNRSTVDGYAVVARDTFGASEGMPVFLDVSGSVEMGKAIEKTIKSGNAVYVPTGGMLPEGADGMVMVEYTENLDERTIAVNSAIAPGENMIYRGDDVRVGVKLVSKGETINPQLVGVLAAVGINKIKAKKDVRIAIISTGDEIVNPFGEVKYGEIRDINTYALSALAEAAGAVVTNRLVLRDDYELLRSTLEKEISRNEIVVISGGSSVGIKDVTAKVIDSFGEPGVFVHGVAVKPGKPTIVGRISSTAVFGLPGHPVSAMVIFKVFVEYLINKLKDKKERKLFIQAESSSNIHSSPGKETYQMVELEEAGDKYLAKPVHAKSAAVTHLTRVHGYVRIDMNKEGIKKGEAVKVELI